ncbi:hypothetical protein Tco_1267370 [Tanacetum coccineum]
MNCPLAEAFTKIPLVLYQNFLREFWCTIVVEDPNPLKDDSEVRPLTEFIINFTVMNGKKSLTLDNKTFCESTRLDYNKGNYVSHPALKVVKVLGKNYSSTEISLNMLLGSKYSQDLKFRSFPNALSQSNFTKDPSKVTPIELTASMIEVINLESSVTPLPYSVKKGKKKSQTGFHSSLDEDTRSSNPLPEGKLTDPKDSEGNKQPADMGLPATHPDEDAEYQVDKTQSTRFEVSVLDQNQGKTSYKVELDSEPMVLITVVDIQALLGASDDEL